MPHLKRNFSKQRHKEEGRLNQDSAGTMLNKFDRRNRSENSKFEYLSFLYINKNIISAEKVTRMQEINCFMLKIFI